MKLVKVFTVAVLAFVYICHKEFKLKKIVTSLVILITFFFAAHSTDRNVILIAALFILCADVTSFRKIVKASLMTASAALLCIIGMSQVGILPDYLYTHEGMPAHSLGFGYYSTVPFIVLYCVLQYMYLRKNLAWFELAGIFVLNYITYRVSSLRLSYYLSILLLIMYIVLIKFDMIALDKGKWKYIACLFYPVGFLFTVWSAKHYTIQGRIWRIMDDILNNRISLSNTAMNRYPITLFGQYIDMQGNLYHVVNYNYFYIDSGFIYSLLGYGLLFTIIVLFMYSYLFRCSCEENDKMMFIWLMIVLIFSIVNNSWLNITFNPILLCFMMYFGKNHIQQKQLSVVQHLFQQAS